MQIRCQFTASRPRLQNDKRDDRFALDRVRARKHRNVRYLAMGYESRLDLHGAESVAGNIHHVVNSAANTEITLLVALRGIACDVGLWASNMPNYVRL